MNYPETTNKQSWGDGNLKNSSPTPHTGVEDLAGEVVIASVFKAPVSNTKSYEDVTWNGLYELLMDEPEGLPDNTMATKAKYGKYYVRGLIAGKRNDAWLGQCSLVILDNDKPVDNLPIPTPKESHDVLSDIAHVVHSTATPGRSRIVFPVDNYDKKDTDKLTLAAYQFCRSRGLNFKYANESAVKSQPFFLPQTTDFEAHQAYGRKDGIKFNLSMVDHLQPLPEENNSEKTTQKDSTHNPMRDFLKELNAGTIHQAVKKYAGWRAKTSDLTTKQIFDEAEALIDTNCSDPQKVQRWHDSERAGIEKWFRSNVVNEKQDKPGDRPYLIDALQPATEITVKKVYWRWKPILADRKFHLLAARGGSAKTTLACDLAARVTTGKRYPMSDFEAESFEVGSVLFVTTEDEPDDTLLPRFLSAGGNPEKLFFLSSSKHHLDLNERSQELEAFIECLPSDRALVILDPVTSMTGDANTHVDSNVKRLSGVLSGLAIKHNISILGIIHFRKGDPTAKGNSLVDMVTGSAGWVNSARVALACFLDEKTGTGYFGVIKSNIGPTNCTLTYKPVIENDVVHIEYQDIQQRNIEGIIREVTARESNESKKEIRQNRAINRYGEFFTEHGLAPAGMKDVRNYVKEMIGQRITENDLREAEIAGGYITKPGGKGKPWMMHPPGCHCEKCTP
jgi:AAA domain